MRHIRGQAFPLQKFSQYGRVMSLLFDRSQQDGHRDGL